MAEFFKTVFEGVVKLILSVQWYDIVDIALVAFLVYYCIKLVRQTRAFHLIKGIIFVGAVYMLVSALNMSATSYLFSHIFGDIVIVMILLFQPEIRHAIESFGRGDIKKLSIFSLKGSDSAGDQARAAANSIAKAVSNMSDKKIGALVVIEGKTALNDIISTGSPIDSAISAVVIENIFFPKAPLHDGAMVIRDNRINCAGCILPLTQKDIGRELGTRHRAALGMSENSDALVVVVSEETGSMSIALNGELERNLTHGEVMETITQYLGGDEAQKQSILKKRWRKK